jgi:hypothetical protein
MDFNMNLKGKIVEALEKAPKVRTLCYWILTLVFLGWVAKPIILELIGRCL